MTLCIHADKYHRNCRYNNTLNGVLVSTV